MKKIWIVVEGQTEETFVRDTIAPHLKQKDIYPTAILVTTRRVAGAAAFKGGVIPYGRMKKDILRLLDDSSATLVTTMLDYYGLPKSFPGRAKMVGDDCYQRVTFVEDEFRKDIMHPRFLPYLMLHEFEAMMFVSPEQIAAAFPDVTAKDELLSIKTKFKTPEEIDDSPQTCPSARILAHLPQYKKVRDGPRVTDKIGIDRIRNECPHFHAWLKTLESMA